MQKIFFSAHVLLGLAFALHAQKSQAQIIYHNGQLFEKNTIIETTSKITGPSSTVNMRSNSAINTVYRVTDSSNTGYTFDFTIKNLTADLESGGKKMTYNSNGPADTASLIQKGFDAVVGKKIKLSVNKKGVITWVDAAGPQATGGQVAPQVQAGIAKFTNGTVFDLNTAMPVTPASKVGDVWSDSSVKANTRQAISYTIKSITNGIAAVTYNGIIASQNMAPADGAAAQEYTTKINGELTINLSTGIVETRTSNFITSSKVSTANGILQTLVNSTSKEVLVKR